VRRWCVRLGREALDAVRADAVYVCVPPFAHGPAERLVLDRGLPLFVEKPVALDVATADDIARRVAASGVVTGTGYHWRYLDVVERARTLLTDSPASLAAGYWLDKRPPVGWWPTWTAPVGRWWSSSRMCSTLPACCSARPPRCTQRDDASAGLARAATR
jgi:predicted dehydrogenase